MWDKSTLLFTEAHLEYNAGLVVSIGNRRKSSPMEHETSAAALAKSLQACRQALVSRAKAPINPSEAAINGTMFTPFVGVQWPSWSQLWVERGPFDWLRCTALLR